MAALVLGVISFVVIMSVLVMFTVFLAREILEVRRQDTFIDSVTHELKTPLTSIRMFSELLAEGRVTAIQSIDAFHGFFPMEVTATPAETARPE